ncbi:MAG: type II secretion system protein [Candidatus Omnitrophota bacterium]
MHKTRIDKRGFSLMELLITGVIVVILVSIAVPGYLRVRFNMGAEKAKFNLSQIYNAQRAYWMDHWDATDIAVICSYVRQGEEAELTKYIDCVIEDDDGTWYYQLTGADGKGTAATFSAEAYRVGTPNIKLIIDQTGKIELQDWPY